MPGSNSRPNVSEGYEVPLSYRGCEEYNIIVIIIINTTININTINSINASIANIITLLGHDHEPELGNNCVFLAVDTV